MKIGITVGIGSRSDATIEGLVARAQDIEQRGFAAMWMANAFGLDAITALAVAGRASTGIEVGTAVVPTYPRHPVTMAQQALTAQQALGGRFTLGIGLSHKVMMSDSLGLDFDRPARHMREYLAVLMPLLRGEPVSFQGDLYRVNARVAVPDATPVPVLVAAMGAEMLKLAGRHTDGTILSWVGPRAIESHILPRISKAAAGRPAPRIVAGLPIALTNDAEAAREQMAAQTASYYALPSYRAMFDIEGVARTSDVALVGDEKELDAALARLESAGATDYAAQIVSVGPGSATRALDYLASR